MTEDQDTIRTLPHAVGPEKAVISCLLQNPDEALAILADSGFSPEHLYLPQHRTIFAQASAQQHDGLPLDLVTFVQRLLDTGNLDRCGGPAAISDLYTYSPTTLFLAQHAKIVTEKWILREIIRTSNETLATAHDAPDDPWGALDDAERLILQIRDRTQQRGVQSKREAMGEVYSDLHALITGKDGIVGLPTGYPYLDAITNGLRPGQVFVIAARPSMGKSAIMLNIVEHAVFHQNAPSQIFSLEMTQKELLARLLFSRSKFQPSAVAAKALTKNDIARIKRNSAEIMDAPLHIDDTPAITITDLRAKARRAKSQHGIKLIAIDYLQLMRSTTKQAADSREREIGEISAGIKALAKELSIPIIVLAQLNRESEKRGGNSKGIPRMSDLRESGTIEQDADIIGLLYREAYFAADQDEKHTNMAARLIIAKNRSGATGDQHLAFIPELVRFEPGYPPKLTPQEPQKRSRHNYD